MFRYFANDGNIKDNIVIITGNDLKHIKNTLRHKIGDKILVIYNEKEYVSVIYEIGIEEIKCKLIEEINENNESLIDITIFQGLPKKSKMDLIIQQNVELGVKKIVPVITARTIVNIKDKEKKFKKIERWQRIAKESAKQCKRNIIPTIGDIVNFDEAIHILKNSNKEIIVPYEEENNNTLKKVLVNSKQEFVIFIGPEGGFEKKEIQLLKDIGSNIITLGPRILRTETAGLVTTAVIMHEKNELGGV